MSQILLDLGRTQNQINLTQAKYRTLLDENIEARKARQEAQGMPDGFDLTKVEGISLKARQEKSAAKNAAATPEA